MKEEEWGVLKVPSSICCKKLMTWRVQCHWKKKKATAFQEKVFGFAKQAVQRCCSQLIFSKEKIDHHFRYIFSKECSKQLLGNKKSLINLTPPTLDVAEKEPHLKGGQGNEMRATWGFLL